MLFSQHFHEEIMAVRFYKGRSISLRRASTLFIVLQWSWSKEVLKCSQVSASASLWKSDPGNNFALL